MINSCWNEVNFTGDELRIDEVRKLFHQMIEREWETDRGQLPDFAPADSPGRFIAIDWDDDRPLTYVTAWTPNTERLVEIAEYYDVGFVHHYEEMGNHIFGEAVYDKGHLIHMDLDDSDFTQYAYDEVGACYKFEDQECAGDNWEILATLLDRKKAAYREATQPKDKRPGR